MKTLTDAEAAYLSGVFETRGIHTYSTKVELSLKGSDEFRSTLQELIGEGTTPRYTPSPTKLQHCNTHKKSIGNASKCNRTKWSDQKIVYNTLSQLHFKTRSREERRLEALDILEQRTNGERT